jgi:transcriptional antiterminator RfaH
MKIWHETNWYAIQTKVACENLAAMNIGRLAVEVLLPKMRQERQVYGAPRLVTKPLFASYLFARFCPARDLHSIRYARGVRRVVGAGATLFPVDEPIIQTILARLDADGYVKPADETFHPGERVRVESGPLKGLTGIFDREMDDRKRVVILLEAIEYQARAVLEKQFVKPMAQKH